MNNNLKSLKLFLRVCILPDGVFAKLGVVLAGISMLALLRHAATIGLSDTFFLIMGWYDRFLEIIVGWIGVWVQVLLNEVLKFFNIHISIQPHWKHIFILMNIYFIRDAVSYLEFDPRRWDRFSWHLGLGLLLATFFGSASGLFKDDGSSYYSSLAVALMPLIGVLIYDVVERYWYVEHYASETAFSRHDMPKSEAARFYRTRIIERTTIYILAATTFVGVWALVLGPGIAGAGLVAFMFSVLLMAIYWISGRASLHYKYVGRRADHLPVLTSGLTPTLGTLCCVRR